MFFESMVGCGLAVGLRLHGATLHAAACVRRARAHTEPDDCAGMRAGSYRQGGSCVYGVFVVCGMLGIEAGLGDSWGERVVF